MRNKILLVEDEVLIAFAEAASIKGFGYEVLTAVSGEEAVELVEKDGQISLVLMDIDLGRGIDGPEAARQILEKRKLPIVFLTSHGERDFVDRVKKLTRYGYIIKNSGDFVLRSSIEMAFELFEANQSANLRELRLSNAERIAGFGSWELDLDRKQITGSQGAQEIYGLQGEIFPLELVQKLVLPGYRSLLNEALRALLERGVPYDVEFEIQRASDHKLFYIHSYAQYDPDRRIVLGTIQDISYRKVVENEQELIDRLILLVTTPGDLRKRLSDLTSTLQAWSRCEAVGLRLKDGDDYPYFETRGFSAEFVELERKLCVSCPKGGILRDDLGNPVLECMCGNILSGRFDPSKPFFTSNGSFWSNCTTQLLASTTEADRQARTRNRCNGEGYESVALIPMKGGGKIFGLLQFNDRRPNRFSPKLIAQFERVADSLGIAFSQRQAEEDLVKSESFALATLDALSAHIAILDETGRIVAVNRAWRRFAENNSVDPKGLLEGADYLEVCDSAAGTNSEGAAEFAAGLRAVRQGLKDEFSWEYACNSEIEERWFLGRVTRFPGDNETRLVVAHENITERKRNEVKIHSLLKEKELLLKEVHHRIKNNMNTIMNLLALQAAGLKDRGSAQALEIARERLYSMCILYDKLYQNENLREMSVKEYLPVLVDQILRLFPNHSNVELQTTIDDFSLGVKELSTLGIVVNELLTNIMKHAFVDRTRGRIYLEVRKVDAKAHVILGDDGIGLPEAINFETTTGLGLKLIAMAVQLLNGTLRIERATGTRFHLEFKI